MLVLVKPLQFENADTPMVSKFESLPKVTLVRPVQSENAESLIVITLAGMVMLVKPLFENAESLIVCTLVGMLKLVKPLQP